MKTNHIPYNAPAMCVHYAAKNRCAAGWFHGKCALCYNCIRCPEYEPKTGLTYDIINDDEIVKTYGGDYFIEHVIASLKNAFTESPEFISDYYVYADSGILSINDIADDRCMLEFAIVRNTPNKLHIKFNGRIKG